MTLGFLLSQLTAKQTHGASGGRDASTQSPPHQICSCLSSPSGSCSFLERQEVPSEYRAHPEEKWLTVKALPNRLLI